MKYIITEDQRTRLMVKRRLREIKNLIRNLYPFLYPCDYDSLQQYMMAIRIEMFETLILDWFENVDNDVIWDVVTEIYRDEIVENYMYNCKDHLVYEKEINEQISDEPEDNIGKVIQSYLTMNLPNYYGIKRFFVDYNEHFDRYDINIFFDRRISIDMGGGINMLIRNAKFHIGQELSTMFNGKIGRAHV